MYAHTRAPSRAQDTLATVSVEKGSITSHGSPRMPHLQSSNASLQSAESERLTQAMQNMSTKSEHISMFTQGEADSCKLTLQCGGTPCLHAMDAHQWHGKRNAAVRTNKGKRETEVAPLPQSHPQSAQSTFSPSTLSENQSDLACSEVYGKLCNAVMTPGQGGSSHIPKPKPQDS